jgi:hypothetical protein
VLVDHPADIRHRASLLDADVGGLADLESGCCECFHADPDELRWAAETIAQLLDELERVRRPPASANGAGTAFTKINADTWQKLLEAPRQRPQ